eukprot:TRINITY_DN27605_c0_g1_i1.p1 TRINITY_DN27605_c0_g1~~TRINITY_DN27605_c0_g1_i1.p1  ORF type:complete len:665 (+),score=228.14 TRINITY_DN27605_c0_g1_i1:135-2129(+)
MGDSAGEHDAAELLKRVLRLDGEEGLSFCKVDKAEFLEEAAAPQEAVVESLAGCGDTLASFIPDEISTDGAAGAGRRFGDMSTLEAFAVESLPMVLKHLGRAKVGKYRVVGLDVVWALLTDVQHTLADYHAKQVAQGRRFAARLDALEQRLAVQLMAVDDRSATPVPRAHDPTTIRPPSDDPVAVATDSVLERERWMHLTRERNRDEIAQVRADLVHREELTADLRAASDALCVLISDGQGVTGLVDSLAASAGSLKDEVAPLGEQISGLLDAHILDAEGLLSRAASDHTTLNGLTTRAAAVITSDQERYQEWYDGCEAEVSKLRQKVEKVRGEIAEVPRSFSREQVRLNERILQLEKDKEAVYRRAVEGVRSLLDDFDARIKETRAEIAELHTKKEAVMGELGLRSGRLEGELAAMRERMEAEAKEKTDSIEWTRKRIKALTSTIETRCERLEYLHRNTKYAIGLASFLRRFVQGCVQTVGKEAAGGASHKEDRLAALHRLVVRASTGMLQAHTRDVFIRHHFVSSWKRAKPALLTAYNFCHQVADPLQAVYKAHAEAMEEQVRHAGDATAALHAFTADILTRAEPSTTYLSARRIQYTSPIDGVVAAVALWERNAEATQPSEPATPITAALLPWTTAQLRRPQPPPFPKARSPPRPAADAAG